MKKLAIVFFYLGKVSYQNITLALAKFKNENADVFLITDFVNEKYPPGIDIIDAKKYGATIGDFKRVYVHKTTCAYEFEFASLCRWLIYFEWWKTNSQYDLFVADSDVMICSDLSDIRKQWAGCAYTLSMRTAGGQSFWFDFNAMASYVDSIWGVYRHKNSSEAKSVFKHFENLQSQAKPGGVCDMTFFAKHAAMSGFSIGETTDIFEDATFDHNILMPQGYKYVDGRKEIYWENGHPFCWRDDVKKWIKFHTLHMSCSGGWIEAFYPKAMEGI